MTPNEDEGEQPAPNEEMPPALSAEAISLYLYLSKKPYVPKSVVDVQWSAPTRDAFYELLAAGLVGKIIIYELLPVPNGQQSAPARSNQDDATHAAITDAQRHRDRAYPRTAQNHHARRKRPYHP